MDKKSLNVTPRTLQGFVEYLPSDQIAFNHLLHIVRDTYEEFGFLPIETPAIELSEILFAKGGGETEKEIYRFEKGKNDLSLHFDLTVPLARYTAQHEGELAFPFRRYQIQKVWRAERPQRGRFREFYQCDIDVIGSENVLHDAEIINVIYTIFKKFDFGKFTIKLNTRKVLNGFFASLDLPEEVKVSAIMRIVDKFDKIGVEGVEKLLLGLEVKANTVIQILDFISFSGSVSDVIAFLDSQKIKDEKFLEGIIDLKKMTDAIDAFGVPAEYYEIDLKIARGLDYYTGTVYETFLDDYPKLGSVCSGGRYDDLASLYTKTKLPGVGISIGLTRLFYQLKESGLLKVPSQTTSKVLVTRMDDNLNADYFKIAQKLRSAGISCEVYFDDAKLKKQLKYANRLGIPYVIVMGSDEKNDGVVTLKGMQEGSQDKISVDDVVKKLTKLA